MPSLSQLANGVLTTAFSFLSYISMWDQGIFEQLIVIVEEEKISSTAYYIELMSLVCLVHNHRRKKQNLSHGTERGSRCEPSSKFDPFQCGAVLREIKENIL